MTCYVDFETHESFELIRCHMYDSLHNRIELTYPAEKKSRKGYLIYQLRPDRKHIIKIELINDGESLFAPDSLTVEIPKLPTGELDFQRFRPPLFRFVKYNNVLRTGMHNSNGFIQYFLIKSMFSGNRTCLSTS